MATVISSLFIILPSLFIIYGLCIIIAILVKWNLHHSLPIVVLALIPYLYIGYLLGVLHLFCYALLAAPILAVWLYVKKKDARLLVWKTFPQALAYGVSIAFILVATRHSHVALWDELRLWGAYPKILHSSNNSLQLGSDALLVGAMQPYTPGLPLFLYFIQAFGKFSENLLYFGYCAFCSAMLAPLIKGVSLKRPFTLLAKSCAIVILPMYFANSANDLGDYFYALYVETALGLLLGYGCYLLSKRVWSNNIGAFSLGIIGASCFLIKSGSALLVAPIAGIAIFKIFQQWKKGIDLPASKALLRVSLVLLPIVMVYSSWKMLLRVYGVEPGFAGNYRNFQAYKTTANPFMEYLISGSVRDTPSWLFERFIPVQETPFVGLQSFLFFGSILLILSISLFGLTEVKRKKARVAAVSAAIVISILQVVGIFVLTSVAFGGVFLSTPRYTSLALVCMGSTILLIFFSGGVEWDIRKTVSSVVSMISFAVSVIFVLLLFPSREGALNNDEWLARASVASQELSSQANSANLKNMESPEKIFILYPDSYESSVGFVHRMHFNALGSGTRISQIFGDSEIFPTNPKAPADYRNSDPHTWFSETVNRGECNYVFVSSVSTELQQVLGGGATSVMFRSRKIRYIESYVTARR
ncbi:MAG: hypothetical protein ACRDAX_07750 [Propionibacteriaceae bacterium]